MLSARATKAGGFPRAYVNSEEEMRQLWATLGSVGSAEAEWDVNTLSP